MIITCNKCSTSFNLDDSLVTESGSKVRCSVCKDIFTAYPAPLEPEIAPEPEIEEPPALSLEDDTDDGLLGLGSDADEDLSFEESDDFEMDDNEFSLEEPGLSLDPPDMGMEVDEFDEDPDDLELGDIGFDQEDSELELEDSEFDQDGPESSLLEDDLDQDDSGLDLGDTGPMEEEPDLELETSEIEIDDASLEIEDDEPEHSGPEELDSVDSGLEIDDVFSLEDSEFGIEQDEDTGAEESEGAEVQFELSDDEDEDEDEDEFDGIEFEPLDEGYGEDEEIEELSIEALPDEDESGSLEFEDDITSLEMEDDADAENLSLEIEEGIASETTVSEEEGEDEFELEFDVEEEAAADTEPELGIDEPSEKDTALITPEDDFNEYDEVLDQETEPETDLEEETIEIDDTQKEDLSEDDSAMQPPPISASRRRKKKPFVSAPLLIIVLLFFLVAGAWVASLMTGIKIPFLSDVKIPYVENLIKPPASKQVEQTKIEVDSKYLNGRYVDNSTAGKLFVITGRMENVSKKPISHIKIKGILSTKSNKKAQTKVVFCGNIISEETLKTGNIADINKQLMKEEGNHNSNLNVKPGGSLHFMIVFSDLPKELQNFAVEVI